MGNLIYANNLLYYNTVLFRRLTSRGEKEPLVVMSSGSLINSARRIMKECRLETPGLNHGFLVPSIEEEIWNKSGAAYKANII